MMSFTLIKGQVKYMSGSAVQFGQQLFERPWMSFKEGALDSNSHFSFFCGSDIVRMTSWTSP